MNDHIIKSIVEIYMIGYFACVFSWIFGTESRELIKSGMVKPSTIAYKSLWWFYILYVTLQDLEE